MPVHRGVNTVGPFYQYGKTGKKYYYKLGNQKSRIDAKEKAYKQARAIKIKSRT